MTRVLRVLLTALSVVLLIIYPLLAYVGLTRFDARSLGLILLAIVLPVQLLRMGGRKRDHLKKMLPIPLGVAVLLLAASAVDDHRFILALPVLINIVLLAGFASSLRRGSMPLIERFARMQVDELPADEVAYCRSVTIIWSVFLGANAAVCLFMALRAPVVWWALYTGLLAYVAMGLLFAAEYIYRKYRFRRYGPSWHDKIFAKVFPTSAQRHTAPEDSPR